MMAPVLRRPPGAPLLLLALAAMLSGATATRELHQTTRDVAFMFSGYKDNAHAVEEVKRILATPKEAFVAWIQTFKVNVPEKEWSTRLEIFQSNAKEVLRLNSEKEMEWTAGFNEYSALKFEQFAERLRARFDEDIGDNNTDATDRLPPKYADDADIDPEPILNEADDTDPATIDPEPILDIAGKKLIDTEPIALDASGKTFAARTGGRRSLLWAPTSWDWKSLGYMTPVRNQGACGSCWAFAAAAAIESLFKIRTGTTYDLSEEQIVDCADVWHGYSSWACSGGYVSEALRYAKNNRLRKESVYGYSATDNDECNVPGATLANSAGLIKGYYKITSKNSNSLMASVYRSPTTVHFDVNSAFQFYSSGIFTGSGCGTSINHAMLAVGYIKGSYWRIKNSWGTGWGESGYIRVKFINSSNSKGTCGMYKIPYRPYL